MIPTRSLGEPRHVPDTPQEPQETSCRAPRQVSLYVGASVVLIDLLQLWVSKSSPSSGTGAKCGSGRGRYAADRVCTTDRDALRYSSHGLRSAPIPSSGLTGAANCTVRLIKT